MPTENVITKRLVLRYADNGQYSFSRLNLGINNETAYGLAEIINSFQSKVFASVRLVTVSQVS